MFGLEYLNTFWKRRSNLDVPSLFVALVLMVGKSKEEVRCVVAACVDRQWLLGMEDIIESCLGRRY